MSHDAVLALFGLTGFAALRVQQTDTRAVVGWKDGTIVCSFRGTQTLTNVLSDIKAWWATCPGLCTCFCFLRGAAGRSAECRSADPRQGPCCPPRARPCRQTPVLPRRFHGGMLVKVHAGGGALLPRGPRLQVLQSSGVFARAGSAFPSLVRGPLIVPPPAHVNTLCTAGFYQAFTAGDFSAQLLARIDAVVAGFSPGAGLRIFLTGGPGQGGVRGRGAAP